MAESVGETKDHHNGVVVRVREARSVHDASGVGRKADVV